MSSILYKRNSLCDIFESLESGEPILNILHKQLHLAQGEGRRTLFSKPLKFLKHIMFSLGQLIIDIG